MMQYLALGLPDHQSELDLPLADDIKFGDTGLVMRAAGESIVSLSPMKERLRPPAGKRRGPAFNFRFGGRYFGDSKRCLVPASAF
ncbi:hypothetical protein ACDY96_28475 [Rhizobium mongolense]|uniref:hypothetical protein n=1 Tax=Rhizobium mongolense TaxID=57676 RepID=UPI003557BF6E